MEHPPFIINIDEAMKKFQEEQLANPPTSKGKEAERLKETERPKELEPALQLTPAPRYSSLPSAGETSSAAINRPYEDTQVRELKEEVSELRKVIASLHEQTKYLEVKVDTAHQRASALEKDNGELQQTVSDMGDLLTKLRKAHNDMAEDTGKRFVQMGSDMKDMKEFVKERRWF